MARKVTVNIELDGQAISHINYLSIHQPINGHHRFELRIPITEKEKSLKEATQTYIGKEAKFEIASGSGKKEATNFFKGIITSISLSKHQGAHNEIIYHGFSPTLLMDDGPHSQSFTEKKLDKIIKEVVGKYGLTVNSKAAFTNVLPYFVQYKESSFQFINRLAALYGEWFYYNGEELYFGTPPSSSPIEMTFGNDLNNFDLELNIVPTNFKKLGYDALSHQHPESPSSSANISGLDEYGQIAARASDDLFVNEPTYLDYHDIKDKSELDELTKKRKATQSGRFVVFNGASDNYELKVGSVIKVKGSLGTIADLNATDVDYGEFRVIKIAHTTDHHGNYQNHFKAVPSSLESPPSNPNVKNPIAEIQPAEVIDNHDPEELGRIQVQCWWQKPTGENSPWIRVAANGAGAGHGSYFVPEKGGQVLVGFEHHNPNKPYVIGSLFHGEAKPDGLSDPDNNKKSLKTKSGNEIYLSDEGGKEEIAIKNGTNTITLNLGEKKITISSEGGTLELKAKEVKITGDTSVSINGGGSTIALDSAAAKMDGKTAEVTGTTTAKLSSLTATVEGQTLAEVKGAMVKLN